MSSPSAAAGGDAEAAASDAVEGRRQRRRSARRDAVRAVIRPRRRPSGVAGAEERLAGAVGVQEPQVRRDEEHADAEAVENAGIGGGLDRPGLEQAAGGHGALEVGMNSCNAASSSTPIGPRSK